MFDATTPRVLLGGRSGPIDIMDFIDLVDRNKRVDGIGWRREINQDKLGHLCTMSVGDPNWGDSRNVPTPQVPEFTQQREDGWIICRGWRMLLVLFIQDGWIYPTQEIRKWLGFKMWDYARAVCSWPT